MNGEQEERELLLNLAERIRGLEKASSIRNFNVSRLGEVARARRQMHEVATPMDALRDELSTIGQRHGAVVEFTIREVGKGGGIGPQALCVC